MLYCDFEKPIEELENKIADLKDFSVKKKVDLSEEVSKLENKLTDLQNTVYSNMTPWQKVLISRHPKRPTMMDYLGRIADDFEELHGDRFFGDDKALLTGLCRINGIKMAVLGHQKGKDTSENIKRNFGCAHPEGYRKAMRIMRLAERFSLPVVCFIDTPGAYPGIGAEERGQALAIAENIRDMYTLRTPIIVVVIGEGGSGGALGIGIGDKVLMLQYSYYSVISPEGCAAILWKDSKRAPDAAASLNLTSDALLKFGIIDGIISEPLGGAHRDPEVAANNLKEEILKGIGQLVKVDKDKLLEKRYDRFRKIGVFKENQAK